MFEGRRRGVSEVCTLPLREPAERVFEAQVDKDSHFTRAGTDSNWHCHSRDDLRTVREIERPASTRAHVRRSRPRSPARSYHGLHRTGTGFEHQVETRIGYEDYALGEVIADAAGAETIGIPGVWNEGA